MNTGIAEDMYPSISYDKAGYKARFDHVNNVGELIAFWVMHTPEAIAISHNDQNISYREFNSQAEILAKKLLSRGVKKCDRVAICLDRSIAAIVAVYAVLLIGATYVPIDTSTPEKRIQYIVQDSQAKVVITSQKYKAVINNIGLSTLICDEDEAFIHSISSAFKPDLSTSQDLAYIIYTSGSTGNPKGVMLSHANVMYYMRWIIGSFDIDCNDVFDFSSPLSFDFSVTCTLLPIACGAKIFICDEINKLDPQAYLTHLERNQVSFTKLTPGHFNKITQFASIMKHLQLANLRWIFLGGEACIADDIKCWIKLFPEHKVVNEYGPTEITVAASAYVIDQYNVDSLSQEVPIGYAAPGAEIFLLRDNGELINDINTTGEICVIGNGVAQGYLNKHEITLQKFIDWIHPITQQTVRMYKTSDFGEWLQPGLLNYQGRKELYIKLRGYRVELAEIENVINRMQGVNKAVVAVDDSEKLLCFVQFKTPDYVEKYGYFLIMAELDLHLPKYMHPNMYHEVKVFPLNNNGKIDKNNLLKNINLPRLSDIDAIHADTDFLRKFAHLCARVLKVKPIDLDKGFINYGGHSLLAMELVLLAKTELKVDLKVSEILANQPLNKIGEKAYKTQNSIQIMMPNQTLNEAPLSYQQRSVIFLESLMQSRAYHVAAKILIRGNLNICALENALNVLFLKHKQLRVKLTNQKGKLYQTFHENYEMPLCIHDCQGLDSESHEVKALTQDAYDKKFNLNTDLPIRLNLLKLKDHNYMLFIVWHHLVTDEWSANLFFKDLEFFYSHFIHQQGLPQYFIDDSYFNYSNLQSTSGFERDLAEGLKFWRQQLEGTNSNIDLPYSYSLTKANTLLASRYNFELSKEQSNLVHKVCNEQDITPFCWFMTLYQTLLMSFSGQFDFNIGIPVANRNYAEFQHVIGFFANTVPFPVKLQAQQTYFELMQDTKSRYLNLLNFQHVPFEKIAEVCANDREYVFNPLFQVMFVYQNKENTTLKLPGLCIQCEEFMPHNAKLPLILFVYESGGVFHISFEYANNLFDKQTIHSLAESFNYLNEQALSNPNLKLSEYQLLKNLDTARQKNYIGKQSNFPQVLSLIQQFSQQVENIPECIAVQMGEIKLTYQELDLISNNLAQWLHNSGVNSAQVVGIGVPRSIEHICCILAILKLNAIYCPIDLNYPEQKVKNIIIDAQIKFLIVDAKVKPNFKFNCHYLVLPDRIDTLIQDNGYKFKSTDSNLAYVMYSSGSTGNPKGILVPQRGILRLVLEPGYMTFRKGQGIAHCASPYFDASTFEIWGALLNGARLIIPDNKVLDSLETFSDFIEKGIDVLWLTKSLFDELSLYNPNMFANIEYLLIGGEALDPKTVSSVLQSKYPPKHILNGYGPTECTTFTCVHEIVDKDLDAVSIPIGRPIANTQIRIVDTFDRLLPLGFRGELLISGDGLATRYLNNQALTQEKFITLTSELLNPWYRSGDIVRVNEDHNLTYIGRSDVQVKIRGFRVELDGIASVISDMPGVERACVIYYQKTLLAFVVIDLANDTQKMLKSMSEHCLRNLPAYEQPNRFIVIDNMPITPTGKIDQKKLQEIANETKVMTKSNDSLPYSSTEKKLIKIWNEILAMQFSSKDDSFFELGGNSIKLLRLCYEIQQIFSVKVALADLLKFTTITQQAELIAQAQIKTQADIIIINEGLASETPVYFIHPSSGQALCYKVFEGLNIQSPLYALSDPYFQDSEYRFESLQEMAQLYSEMILQHLNGNKLILAGWSFGGLLAVEIAKNLKAKDVGVENVIMFDSYAKYNRTNYTKIKERLLQEQAQTSDQYRKCQISEELQNLSLAVESNIQAYDGKIYLIRAKEKGSDDSDKLVDFYDPTCGWNLNDYPYLSIAYSEGTHQTILALDRIGPLVIMLKSIGLLK